MARTTFYKNYQFAEKSEAQKLYDAKKFKELDTHLKEVDRRAKALEGDPREAIFKCRLRIVENLTLANKDEQLEKGTHMLGEIIARAMEKGISV